MKRRIILLTVFVMILSSLVCFAEPKANYDLPPSWVTLNSEKNSVSFGNNITRSSGAYKEIIFIESLSNPSNDSDSFTVYSMPEASLNGAAMHYLSNDAILSQFKKTNVNAQNTQIIDGTENSTYKNINGIDYYKYYRDYTIKDEYYLTCSVTDELYITFVGGFCYIIRYEGLGISENQRDVEETLLKTIKYGMPSQRISIYINDERIYPDSEPVLVSDRTLVPIRAIAEKLGYTVSWEDETECVTLKSSNNSTTIKFCIGDTSFTKNDSDRTEIDVPAMLLNDRTYLPLRAVAEATGARVDWVNETNSVLISSK